MKRAQRVRGTSASREPGPTASATSLAIRASIALAELYRSEARDPNLIPLQEAAAFCRGELSVWSTWADDAVDADLERCIGLLLRHRPRTLADHSNFVAAARLTEMPEYTIADDHACPRHGRSPADVVEELVRALAATKALQTRVRKDETLPAGPVGLWVDGRRYSLVVPPVAASKPVALPIRQAPARPDVALSFEELRETAKALSDTGRGDHLLRTTDVLDVLVDLSGKAAGLSVPAGATTLLSAPTGKGKSVLLRVLAVQQATSGQTVTLVVPDAAAVIALTRDIEADLASLGSSASAAGLVSPSGAMGHFARRAVDRERDPGETRWVAERWAYACALSGAIEAPRAGRRAESPAEDAPSGLGAPSSLSSVALLTPASW